MEDLIVRPSGCASPAGGCIRRPRPPASLAVGWKAWGRALRRPAPCCSTSFAFRLRGLRLPEDLRELVDRVQQILALCRVLGPLRVAGFLRGVPEELVQLRVVLEVLGLEVVRPQHPEVLLDQVGSLLLDGDRAVLEDRVLGPLVL